MVGSLILATHCLPVCSQPENIYEYGARYFSMLVEDRAMAMDEQLDIRNMSSADLSQLVFGSCPWRSVSGMMCPFCR